MNHDLAAGGNTVDGSLLARTAAEKRLRQSLGRMDRGTPRSRDRPPAV